MSSPKISLISKFILTALTLMNLNSCCCDKQVLTPPGIDTETLMEVVLPYAINLEHERSLRLEDSAVYYGRNNSYIKKLRLSFISQSIIELKEARGLLVDVVDNLIGSLNNDPFLGPMIFSHPLTSNDIEICIKFESYFGLYVDKMYIHWIMLQDDRSYFYAFDLTNEFNIWDTGCECCHQRIEPFYKSRQIVNIERAAEENYQHTHKKQKSLFMNEIFDGDFETNQPDIQMQF